MPAGVGITERRRNRDDRLFHAVEKAIEPLRFSTTLRCMILWWEPNATPRVWSGLRHFCWKFLAADIPLMGGLMLYLHLVAGRWMTLAEALIFLTFLACITAVGVWFDRKSVPLSYHFRGDLLVVNNRDGSQDEFARWVRVWRLTTGIIHAQNDTKTVEIKQAMYAAPAKEREAAHNG
jgi:hypothetical protein